MVGAQQVLYCSIHGCNEINLTVGYVVAAVVTQLKNFGAHSTLPRITLGEDAD
jgi:hypothetical protein